ncbi:unnamed protein product, partial [marine sediment metagenome]
IFSSKESIVLANRFANKIKKNNHETLNTVGVSILIIQKFKIGSIGEYHKLNSTKKNIKKMLTGTNIIVSKTIKRVTIIPLTLFDIFLFHFSVFKIKPYRHKLSSFILNYIQVNKENF